MITKVFTHKGQVLTTAEAFTALVKLNPTDKYSKKKAAGSLGGSTSSGFLKRHGSSYTRTRNTVS